MCTCAMCSPGLCGVNVNSLDPIGALEEMPLQEGGVRQLAKVPRAQTHCASDRALRSSIRTVFAKLAVTLTSSRRGCGDRSNRSSAHLIHSKFSRLQNKHVSRRGVPWLQAVSRLARRPSSTWPVQCAALCPGAQVINLVGSGCTAPGHVQIVLQQHTQ